MPKKITSERLILKSIEPDQAKALSGIANNKKIWLNLRDQFPYPYTLDHADNYIKMVNSNPDSLIWAINFEHELVGMVGIHPGKDVYAHTAELGYWIGEPFWGKGFMTEALTAVIEYTFNNTEILRIHAGLFDYNLGSKNVLEKAGFQFEGKAKMGVKKDGKLVDELKYGLVRIKP